MAHGGCSPVDDTYGRAIARASWSAVVMHTPDRDLAYRRPEPCDRRGGVEPAADLDLYRSVLAAAARADEAMQRRLIGAPRDADSIHILKPSGRGTMQRRARRAFGASPAGRSLRHRPERGDRSTDLVGRPGLYGGTDTSVAPPSEDCGCEIFSVMSLCFLRFVHAAVMNG